jgi:uncharacterized OB-fold protein
MAKPYPAVTPETAFFWTGGEAGELRFQRCRACQRFVHPPQPACPECLSDNLGVEVVSGRANVAACTVNQHTWHPDFPPPYAIVIVEIEEAPYVRLTSRMVNCDPHKVAIGDPVRVVFEPQGPAWMPLFEPAAERV